MRVKCTGKRTANLLDVLKVTASCLRLAEHAVDHLSDRRADSSRLAEDHKLVALAGDECDVLALGSVVSLHIDTCLWWLMTKRGSVRIKVAELMPSRRRKNEVIEIFEVRNLNGCRLDFGLLLWIKSEPWFDLDEAVPEHRPIDFCVLPGGSSHSSPRG